MANAHSDFDPLDIRNAMSGSEDADTAASVPQEMAKALANLTSTKMDAADHAPMTMRMPGQSELQNESPTRIVPPLAPNAASAPKGAGASERPKSDFASTVMQKDLDETIAGEIAMPNASDFAMTIAGDVAMPHVQDLARTHADFGPPPPSSLARAAQTSFDQRPLERKPLVTTVAMSPISRIPLPSAARGAAAGNGTVAGVVRATRMPSMVGISPSNSPPRALSQEQADMPAPSEGATVMVSPDREAERGPETAPPAALARPKESLAETKSVFAPDAPAENIFADAPSGPSGKFVGTLASASAPATSAPSPITPPEKRVAPPPSSDGRDESTMMVLPEELEDVSLVTSVAAGSQPSDGGTMMLAPAKPAAPIPESVPEGTVMLAPANRAPAPVASPQPPQAAPVRVAPMIKTVVGIAPPVFANPGPMVPTPIVSISPAPPPPQKPSMTPAMPPTGSHQAMPALNSLPVRPTVQLAATRSMPPPPPPPKALPQTPMMPPAVRASYAQLPPHQWPAEQNLPHRAPAVPQGSIGPQSDPSRPLTYQVFDPSQAANVMPRSPSMPSRASLEDYKPKMSVGMKVGLVVLGVCLAGAVAGAIMLGASEDPPRPTTPASATVPVFVPVPVPTPLDTTPLTDPPPPAGDPPPVTTASAAPTATGKPRKPPKGPKDPGSVPPNPFGSSMPGKRK